MGSPGCSGRSSRFGWGALAATVILAAFSGCGKKGAPLPPIRVLPEEVRELRARQVAGQVVLSFSRPGKRTDGTPLGDQAALEILMNAREPAPRSPREVIEAPSVAWTIPAPRWDDYGSGRRMEVGLSLDRIASALRLEGGATALSGRTLSFVIGVEEPKRSRSAAGLASIKVCQAPPAPRRVETALREEGVLVTWEAPEGGGTGRYNLYRQPQGRDGTGEPIHPDPLSRNEYLDRSAAAEGEVRYTVRAVASSQDECESTGTVSAPVAWVDRFPPAPPQGLAAVEEQGAIRLFWRPNREPDLLGYRVYRAEGPDGDLVPLLTEPQPGTSYTDTSAVPGVAYSYAVTAVDGATPANESPFSERASEELEGSP